jgi:hypothetical protein
MGEKIKGAVSKHLLKKISGEKDLLDVLMGAKLARP